MKTHLYNLTVSNVTNTTEYFDLLKEDNNSMMYYTLLIVSSVTLLILKSLLYFYFSTCASIKLHRDTFNRLIAANMDFFDMHLTGNIVNRFAKDMGIVDEFLPKIAFEIIRVRFDKFWEIINDL